MKSRLRCIAVVIVIVVFRAGFVFAGTGHDPDGHPVSVITVSSRTIDHWAVPSSYGHLAIERWEPGDSVVIELEIGDELTRDDLNEAGYVYIAGWELLRNGGDDNANWVVARCFPVQVGTINVNISIILQQGTGTEHVVIYTDAGGDLHEQWDVVSGHAGSYPFAEQDGFNGVFQYWPNSRYQNVVPPSYSGNNSNTFIRWLVNIAGLDFAEPSVRSHPGNAAPSNLSQPSGSCGDDPVQMSN